jgi:hypothetical protein
MKGKGALMHLLGPRRTSAPFYLARGPAAIYESRS